MLPRIAILPANFFLKLTDFSGIWRITARHSGRTVRALRTGAFQEITRPSLSFYLTIEKRDFPAASALSKLGGRVPLALPVLLAGRMTLGTGRASGTQSPNSKVDKALGARCGATCPRGFDLTDRDESGVQPGGELPHPAAGVAGIWK